MQFIILTVFAVGFSLAAPAASQAEIEADKKNIQEAIAVLKDDTKTPAEKQTAYTNMINNLQGPYKEQYNQIMEKLKTAIENIQSPTAKSAAQQFLQLWESGSLFGSKDLVKEQAKQILEPLSESDKNELHNIQKQFSEEFKNAFKDIMPSHGEEKDD